MSHLFKEGFFTNTPAWHRLGRVLDDYPGRHEAMVLAGHDHEIIEIPLFVNPFSPLVVPTFKARVRTDTEQVIAVVPETNELISNDVPWDIVDAICNVENVQYETGGLLNGTFAKNQESWYQGNEAAGASKGLVYWVLARLDEPATIPGDNSPIYAFVLATWSHDGSQSLRIKKTNIRVVCANTQSAALGGAGGEFDLSFRHTRKVHNRIEEATKHVDRVRQAHLSYIEAATELAKQGVTEEGVKKFIEVILPYPEDSALRKTDRAVRNVREARRKVVNIFNGETISEQTRNTAYGLLQAGIEYFDHKRKWRTAESHFRRTMLKEDALKAHLLPVVKSIAQEYATT